MQDTTAVVTHWQETVPPGNNYIKVILYAYSQLKYYTQPALTVASYIYSYAYNRLYIANGYSEPAGISI